MDRHAYCRFSMLWRDKKHIRFFFPVSFVWVNVIIYVISIVNLIFVISIVCSMPHQMLPICHKKVERWYYDKASKTCNIHDGPFNLKFHQWWAWMTIMSFESQNIIRLRINREGALNHQAICLPIPWRTTIKSTIDTPNSSNTVL
jgi:hypothetical protein